MRAFSCLRFSALLLLTAFSLLSCRCERPLDAGDLRGKSREELQQMREAVLARHADGSELSRRETAYVEQLRQQERRLENAWVFGEWRERHGARLIFRDDGTVSVGARGGVSEEPSFETTWTVLPDEAGDPVILVLRRDGSSFLYPCHRDRDRLREHVGNLEEFTETGFYFTKIQ